MARSTWLVILIKNIYTLWGRKRFLLPVTYFPKNLVYPFTLRVTSIKMWNASIHVPNRQHILVHKFFVFLSQQRASFKAFFKLIKSGLSNFVRLSKTSGRTFEWNSDLYSTLETGTDIFYRMLFTQGFFYS